MRYDVADYMDVGENGTEEYALMGVGFNSLDESPNAQVDKKAYIHERVSSAKVKGYEGQFPYKADLVKDERVVMKVYDIARNQKTGKDAEVNYLRVELFNPITDKPGVFAARKFLVAVEVSDITGEGANPLEMSGNLNQVGEFIDGQFDKSTNKFTPTTIPETPQTPANFPVE